MTIEEKCQERRAKLLAGLQLSTMSHVYGSIVFAGATVGCTMCSRTALLRRQRTTHSYTFFNNVDKVRLHQSARTRTPINIPSHEQLMTPGGILANLKEKVVEQNLFVWGGFVGAGSISVLAMSATYFGVDTILTTVHLILLGGCVVQGKILGYDRQRSLANCLGFSSLSWQVSKPSLLSFGLEEMLRICSVYVPSCNHGNVVCLLDVCRP